MAEYITAQNHPWLFNRLPQPGTDRTAQMFQLGAQMAQHKRAMEYKEQILAAEQEAKMQAAEGHAALGQVLAKGAGRWTDPEVKREFWETASRYPALMKHPSFRELTQNFELADTAKARADLLGQRQEGQLDVEDARIEGRLTLEQERAKNREALQADKFQRLSGMREDSEEAKLIRDELQHQMDMERDDNRGHPSGQDRFDMPYSDQLLFKSKLDAVQRDPNLKKNTPEKLKQMEAIYREFEPRRRKKSEPAAAPKAVAPAASGSRIKVKSPDGKIGSIPESQVEVAKQKGYIVVE